jgi:hypothetical protein
MRGLVDGLSDISKGMDRRLWFFRSWWGNSFGCSRYRRFRLSQRTIGCRNRWHSYDRRWREVFRRRRYVWFLTRSSNYPWRQLSTTTKSKQLALKLVNTLFICGASWYDLRS